MFVEPADLLVIVAAEVTIIGEAQANPVRRLVARFRRRPLQREAVGQVVADMGVVAGGRRVRLIQGVVGDIAEQADGRLVLAVVEAVARGQVNVRRGARG